MAMNGEPLTVRLPLAVDRELRARASNKGTTAQRYLVALVTRALGASADRAVTLTLTAPSDLIAALASSGVVTIGKVESGPGPAAPGPAEPRPQPVDKVCDHAIAGEREWCPGCQARKQSDGRWV